MICCSLVPLLSFQRVTRLRICMGQIAIFVLCICWTMAILHLISFSVHRYPTFAALAGADPHDDPPVAPQPADVKNPYVPHCGVVKTEALFTFFVFCFVLFFGIWGLRCFVCPFGRLASDVVAAAAGSVLLLLEG